MDRAKEDAARAAVVAAGTARREAEVDAAGKARRRLFILFQMNASSDGAAVLAREQASLRVHLRWLVPCLDTGGYAGRGAAPVRGLPGQDRAATVGGERSAPAAVRAHRRACGSTLIPALVLTLSTDTAARSRGL